MTEQAITKLKRALRKAIENNELAGGSILILKDGAEAFYHQDGLASEGKPVARDTIFRLFSMTKPITAAAVMVLLERGEIDLYEPVSKFLPGFKRQRVQDGDSLVPAARDVTLCDLLSMTSGLVYGGADAAGRAAISVFAEVDRRLLGDNPVSTVDVANMLGQCPLAFQPGTSWQYGTSADVLGAVVEVVSGKRYGDFLRDEIFTPLGMRDTGFYVPDGKRERLAEAYAYDGERRLVPFTRNHLGIITAMDRDPAYESAGGGLVSTMDDSARFTAMLINGGELDGARVLQPRTVRYMTGGRLNEAQQRAFGNWFGLEGYSYGSLMRVLTDGGRHGGLTSPGEYGWDGWLGAYFANCPAERLTFLFMMQRTDAGTVNLTRKLRNIVFAGM